ncbi:MAG TPA: hypothetical protein PLT68_01385 [Actinomycetota bacterium]|nr:hypothetical protein [Actinomycetota bacterium]
MNNPPPRPALRKAPDSDVHPVAAVAPVAVVPPEVLPVARQELRPVTSIGGRTSDTLLNRTPKKVKRTSLQVKVPKHVVKDAKRVAKARGDQLDDIVAAALRGYAERG